MATIESGASEQEEKEEPLKLCKVHPIVVFSILDHYTRRHEGQERVIGTLLGMMNEEGQLEITNCFAVPHTEKDGEVAVGQTTNKAMCAMLSQINDREIIVGWYATSFADGTLMNESSTLIHDFYLQECENPVHLVIDTCLDIARGIAINAFTSGKLGQVSFATAAQGGNETGERYVHKIPVELCLSPSEHLCLQQMVDGQENEPFSEPETFAKLSTGQEAADELESFQDSLHDIMQLLETCLNYVNQVIAGKRKSDPHTSRQIFSALDALPHLDPSDIDTHFNAHLNDLLMVSYLTQITKTQLAIAAKIHSTY
mmetsp:Transcript_3667/g.4600  ORF Transcript_3667/g.4600 Transcript_3667/m.4600 type:complete len:314 (+) Transcript_3667:21-962(+)|eukprot:CAMPEP_0197285858 /NCGR_PEP_ID=MMETSP0890-20130614/1201_1 /TAXON_ID=44058 ORGANISM="Aureoumbra lagunensis, Strain CCMP1510" /NCGR_SAMPLE_ID=MMETSP0890 /ASSEMBLY_ACC=CAM_ASM_000533 /LENGTH=313 /DNA_ID=CAMNT_0042753715 /DNA_START=13 /DNA_END=954 /DNA_ORIENTATION=+